MATWTDAWSPTDFAAGSGTTFKASKFVQEGQPAIGTGAGREGIRNAIRTFADTVTVGSGGTLEWDDAAIDDIGGATEQLTWYSGGVVGDPNGTVGVDPTIGYMQGVGPGRGTNGDMGDAHINEGAGVMSFPGQATSHEYVTGGLQSGIKQIAMADITPGVKRYVVFIADEQIHDSGWDGSGTYGNEHASVTGTIEQAVRLPVGGTGRSVVCNVNGQYHMPMQYEGLVRINMQGGSAGDPNNRFNMRFQMWATPDLGTGVCHSGGVNGLTDDASDFDYTKAVVVPTGTNYVYVTAMETANLQNTPSGAGTAATHNAATTPGANYLWIGTPRNGVQVGCHDSDHTDGNSYTHTIPSYQYRLSFHDLHAVVTPSTLGARTLTFNGSTATNLPLEVGTLGEELTVSVTGNVNLGGTALVKPAADDSDLSDLNVSMNAVYGTVPRVVAPFSGNNSDSVTIKTFTLNPASGQTLTLDDAHLTVTSGGVIGNVSTLGGTMLFSPQTYTGRTRKACLSVSGPLALGKFRGACASASDAALVEIRSNSVITAGVEINAPASGGSVSTGPLLFVTEDCTGAITANNVDNVSFAKSGAKQLPALVWEELSNKMTHAALQNSAGAALVTVAGQQANEFDYVFSQSSVDSMVRSNLAPGSNTVTLQAAGGDVTTAAGKGLELNIAVYPTATSSVPTLTPVVDGRDDVLANCDPAKVTTSTYTGLGDDAKKQILHTECASFSDGSLEWADVHSNTVQETTMFIPPSDRAHGNIAFDVAFNYTSGGAKTVYFPVTVSQATIATSLSAGAGLGEGEAFGSSTVTIGEDQTESTATLTAAKTLDLLEPFSATITATGDTTDRYSFSDGSGATSANWGGGSGASPWTEGFKFSVPDADLQPGTATHHNWQVDLEYGGVNIGSTSGSMKVTNSESISSFYGRTRLNSSDGTPQSGSGTDPWSSRKGDNTWGWDSGVSAFRATPAQNGTTTAVTYKIRNPQTASSPALTGTDVSAGSGGIPFQFDFQAVNDGFNTNGHLLVRVRITPSNCALDQAVLGITDNGTSAGLSTWVDAVNNSLFVKVDSEKADNWFTVSGRLQPTDAYTANKVGFQAEIEKWGSISASDSTIVKYSKVLSDTTAQGMWTEIDGDAYRTTGTASAVYSTSTDATAYDIIVKEGYVMLSVYGNNSVANGPPHASDIKYRLSGADFTEALGTLTVLDDTDENIARLGARAIGAGSSTAQLGVQVGTGSFQALASGQGSTSLTDLAGIPVPYFTWAEDANNSYAVVNSEFRTYTVLGEGADGARVRKDFTFRLQFTGTAAGSNSASASSGGVASTKSIVTNISSTFAYKQAPAPDLGIEAEGNLRVNIVISVDPQDTPSVFRIESRYLDAGSNYLANTARPTYTASRAGETNMTEGNGLTAVTGSGNANGVTFNVTGGTTGDGGWGPANHIEFVLDLAGVPASVGGTAIARIDVHCVPVLANGYDPENFPDADTKVAQFNMINYRPIGDITAHTLSYDAVSVSRLFFGNAFQWRVDGRSLLCEGLVLSDTSGSFVWNDTGKFTASHTSGSAVNTFEFYGPGDTFGAKVNGDNADGVSGTIPEKLEPYDGATVLGDGSAEGVPDSRT